MRALCCVEPDATYSPTEQVQQMRPGPLHLLFCDAAQRTPTCPSRPSSYIAPPAAFSPVGASPLPHVHSGAPTKQSLLQAVEGLLLHWPQHHRC